MNILLILIQVNVIFLLIYLSLIQVNEYFFNTNTGQCIFFIDLFIINTGEYIYFFNTNKDQCIFYIDRFYH